MAQGSFFLFEWSCYFCGSTCTCLHRDGLNSQICPVWVNICTCSAIVKTFLRWHYICVLNSSCVKLGRLYWSVWLQPLRNLTKCSCFLILKSMKGTDLTGDDWSQLWHTFYMSNHCALALCHPVYRCGAIVFTKLPKKLVTPKCTTGT